MIYMYLYAWWLWLRSLEMLVYVNQFQASVRFTCKYEYEEHELREQGFYLHFESDLIWLHEVLSQQPQPQERWRRDRAGGGPLGWVGAASSVTCILTPFGVQRRTAVLNEIQWSQKSLVGPWGIVIWSRMAVHGGYVRVCIVYRSSVKTPTVECWACFLSAHFAWFFVKTSSTYIKIILHHIMWYDIMYEKQLSDWIKNSSGLFITYKAVTYKAQAS